MSESFVPGVETDVFISYAHADNAPLGPEEKEFVTELHHYLDKRGYQLLGQRLVVWRDPKLRGNDILDKALQSRVSRAAVLISVCSPRYLVSEWCRWELAEFVATHGPAIAEGSSSRVFKVLKTPVDRGTEPEPLNRLLGYEFFESSEPDGHEREYLLDVDQQDRHKFYGRAEDLARDIKRLLTQLANPADAGSAEPKPVVYLASTASDVALHRDDIRRELESRGYRVLPDQRLPLDAETLVAATAASLTESRVSVHLLGSRYGVCPEGDARSMGAIQLDLAQARAAPETLTRLVWMASEAEAEAADEPQVALRRHLQTARDLGDNTEVFTTPFESFKVHLFELLERLAEARGARTADVGGPREAPRVYLLCPSEEMDEVGPVVEYLDVAGLDVALPLRSGTEAERRAVHEDELVESDGVLIYWNEATEFWVRQNLKDLRRAPGLGRDRPFAATAVLALSPDAVRYHTSDAAVLRPSEPRALDVLEGFVAALAARDD